MAIHVHGARYVRPDDRGRCAFHALSFGCLEQCDSPALPATGFCLLHTVILTPAEINDLITAHTTPTTGATP